MKTRTDLPESQISLLADLSRAGPVKSSRGSGLGPGGRFRVRVISHEKG